MANYYGKARSNYFAVKDEQSFREDIAKCNVHLLERTTEDGQILFGMMDNDDDGYPMDTWMAWSADDDTDEPEMTWGEFFQKHLADGWVVILMEIGSEKHRFLTGTASAFNNKGEERFIDLSDIVNLGKEIGEYVTSPTY
jgi:hypothetical protein